MSHRVRSDERLVQLVLNLRALAGNVPGMNPYAHAITRPPGVPSVQSEYDGLLEEALLLTRDALRATSPK